MCVIVLLCINCMCDINNSVKIINYMLCYKLYVLVFKSN